MVDTTTWHSTMLSEAWKMWDRFGTRHVILEPPTIRKLSHKGQMWLSFLTSNNGRVSLHFHHHQRYPNGGLIPPIWTKCGCKWQKWTSHKPKLEYTHYSIGALNSTPTKNGPCLFHGPSILGWQLFKVTLEKFSVNVSNIIVWR